MKLLRVFPVELYIVFLPLVTVSIFFSLAVLFKLIPDDFIKFSFDTEAFFGGKFLFFFLSVVYILVVSKFIVEIFLIVKKIKNSDTSFEKALLDTAINVFAVFFWVSIFYFSTLVSGYALNYIFRHVSPENTKHFSVLFTNLDHFVFGVYPSFWLQHILTDYHLGSMTVLAYEKIPIVISVILLSAFLKNTYLLRKFLIAFFIASFIGLPLWTLMPAISPQAMYLENILKVEMPRDVESEIKNVTINQDIKNYLPVGHRLWIDPKGEAFGVSNFPSMHVAWGVIALVIGTSLYAPLILILLPWFVFNVIATVATFQHYAVDGIAGILVALFALYIAKQALSFEKKYFIDTYNLVQFWKQFEVKK